MASAEDESGGGPVAPLPQLGDAPFSLLRVRGGNASGANAGCFGAALQDLVVAPPPADVSNDSLRYALVSNMMIDAAWLFSALPGLLQAKRLVVVQSDGHASDTRATAKALGAASENVPTPSPPLLNEYSSHHAKFFLLFYETGMRLVITSANFIDPDCNRKTQSVFSQDFPRRWPQTDEEKLAERGGQFLGARIMGMEGAEPLPAARCPYERYLRDYLFAALSAHPGLREEAALLLREHDFDSARAFLAASTPGVHLRASGHIDKWGHMRVRALLAADPRPMPARFASALGGRTAAQCSSLGACYASFLAEMGVSFAGGSGGGASPPAKRKRGGGGAGGGKKKKKAGGKKGRSEDEDEEEEDDDQGGGGGPAADRIDDLFWTTVEEVRRSVEGWRAGLSIPANAANASRATLQPLFRRWGDNSPARRELYAPHIKTFARYLSPPPPPPGPSAAAAAAAAALARSNNGNNNNSSSAATAATATAAAAAVPAEVAHVYVGSSNLSMAAWGQLQHEGSQLKVLSYEMGVLITPAREALWRAHPDRAFNATPWQPACAALAARQQQAQQRERDECGGCSLQALAAREVVLYAWHPQCRPQALLKGGGSSSRRPNAPPPGCDPALPPLLVPLPLPFSLRAPRRYGPQDTPWDFETPWPGADSRGRAWAECRATRFYGVVDPTPQEEPW
jgi:tyrosyl-DNA phosphodiesterase-1